MTTKHLVVPVLARSERGRTDFSAASFKHYSAIFQKEVFVELLEINFPANAHTYIMFNHQFS